MDELALAQEYIEGLVVLTKSAVGPITPQGGQPLKKKLLIALIPLTILMLLTSGAVYAADKSNQVKFADPVVDIAVREALKGKTGGPIYQDECELIAYLSVHGNADAIDLTGLEHLSKLRQLSFTNVFLTDFSPLSGLTDLEGISFNSCEITNFTPLSVLPNLKVLSVSNFLFHGPSSLDLSCLTGLQELSITDTRISDVSQLSFPSGLYSLRLQNNGISEIPQLSDLTKLMILELIDNPISDISPLSKLSETYMLACISLERCQIRDITLLAKLNQLRSLHLSGNHISDISALSNLSNLQYLLLEDNDIVDLSPLLEMDMSQKGFQKTYVEGKEYNLKMELHIKGNPLSDASVENYLPQLKERGILADY